jgi:hypothetical protein
MKFDDNFGASYARLLRSKSKSCFFEEEGFLQFKNQQKHI